jgi:hypothetical protein
MSWTTATFRFPSVTHVRGTSGHDEIVPVPEEHITTRDDKGAVLNRSQIYVGATSLDAIPVRNDFTINAESGNATVWINLEPKVGDSLVVLNGKGILRISGQRHLRQQWDPVN